MDDGRAARERPSTTRPGPWPRISDPSVAYDPQDDVWLALGLGIDAGGDGHILLVNRSTDGGMTWSKPVIAGTAPGTFWDKTWITCDTWPQSPHYGNCYIEFDDNSLGNDMEMVTSTDGGATWGPVRSAGCDSGLGGQPVVQPNGNVIVPVLEQRRRRELVPVDERRHELGATAGCVANVSEHGVAANIRDVLAARRPRSPETARCFSRGRTAASAPAAARTTSSTRHSWTA